MSQKLHFTNTQSRLSVIEIMHIEGMNKIVEENRKYHIVYQSPPILFLFWQSLVVPFYFYIGKY